VESVGEKTGISGNMHDEKTVDGEFNEEVGSDVKLETAIGELLYDVACWLVTSISEEDDGDSREPENDEVLNSTKCEELFSVVVHLGELRGLLIVDESRLQDNDRFNFVLFTASVFAKQHAIRSGCFLLIKLWHHKVRRNTLQRYSVAVATGAQARLYS